LSKGITWWAPGIGFVRQVQTVGTEQNQLTIIMKLKSHSLK
jgi:hypothetical protein